MKINTQSIIKVLVCIFALYGLILLVRKLWNRKENNKEGKWSYYVSEQYRYMNMSELKTKVTNKFKELFKAKDMKTRRAIFKDIQTIFDQYLKSNPGVNSVFTYAKDQLIGLLAPLVQKEINNFFKSGTGKVSKALIQQACDMSREGLLNKLIIQKVIDPAFSLIESDAKLKAVTSILSSIGVNLKSLLITVASDKIKPYVDKINAGLLPVINNFSSRIDYAGGNCKFDPSYAASKSLPAIQMNVDDAIIDEMEPFRYADERKSPINP
jgi:hypothetical protein